MRIQHNITAMNSYRNYTNNTSAVAKNLEKLSSGYKINRAGDDAAGLAISEKMRAQITGLKTAQKNAKDGISLVKTGEGALTEVHDMLNRMFELSEQSSNGTYDNEVDRANLQKEISSLKTEIDRIADSVNFNGINLLDGSLGGTTSGGGLTGAPVVNYKGATMATGANGENASTLDAAGFAIQDTVNVDGIEVKVDWSGLTSEEQAVLKKDFSGNNTTSADDVKKAAQLIQDTINKAIDKTNASKGTNVAHIKVTGENGTDPTADSFKFTSGLKSGESKVSFTGVTNSVLGKIFGTAAEVKTAAPVGTLNFAVADARGKFTMHIGNEEVEVDTSSSGFNTDGSDLASLLQTAINTALGNYDTAHGLTGDDALSGKVTVKLNDKGALEFTNNTGKAISFSDKDGGEFAKTLGIASGSGAVSVGGLTLQIGDTADDFNKLTVSINDMHASAMGIAGVDISTQAGASAAMKSIKAAINYVSDVRGDLGATQNRLEHTINNLSVMQENIQDAESSIRDVDVAEEMMAYTKNNILVQSAQAMLAQANQLPQGVLQLLQ